MDATDQRILNLLQAEARMTLREIGERVNLTPPSVSERIHKLEDEGIIEGYSIAINREKIGYAVGGYIMASPEPAKYAAFCAFCEKHPAITEHHHLIGTYNALLHFYVRDTDELDELPHEMLELADEFSAAGARLEMELLENEYGDNGFDSEMEYAEGLFDKERIERFHDLYVKILEGLIRKEEV